MCKNTGAWIEARGYIGISGWDPISRYYTEGVGMNGNINGAIIAALQNPGLKHLSICMLSPEALKAARNSNDKDSE